LALASILKIRRCAGALYCWSNRTAASGPVALGQAPVDTGSQTVGPALGFGLARFRPSFAWTMRHTGVFWATSRTRSGNRLRVDLGPGALESARSMPVCFPPLRASRRTSAVGAAHARDVLRGDGPVARLWPSHVRGLLARRAGGARRRTDHRHWPSKSTVWARCDLCLLTAVAPHRVWGFLLPAYPAVAGPPRRPGDCRAQASAAEYSWYLRTTT